MEGEICMSNVMMECPEMYRDKLFLDVHDVSKILGIGRNSTYLFLQDAPFRVLKIGNLIRIPAYMFWEWYYSKEDMSDNSSELTESCKR